MAQTLKYNGYQGSVEFDLDEKYLHGKVLFIDDAVIYNGATVDELTQSFQDAVDGYIAFCKEIGKEPQKSCSGTFNVRITPDLHRQCVQLAHMQEINLNTLVSYALEEYCTKHSLIVNIEKVNKKLSIINKKIEYHFSTRVQKTKQMFSYSNYSEVPYHTVRC